MDCSIVFGDVNIQLQRLSLQELNVKVVNFIHKGELGVIEGAESFSQL